METKLQRLKTPTAKPLIEIPKTVPTAGFIHNYFDGETFLEEYNERVKLDYKGNSVLKVIHYSDGVVKGSNPPSVILANKILEQEGLRTVTHLDINEILRTKALSLIRTYEDIALIFKDEEKPNSYLAKKIAEQIKKREGKKIETPIIIPLNGLELKLDSNSPLGLTFIFTDKTKIIYAPILSEENNKNGFSDKSENEFPILNRERKKLLYTNNSGLSRFVMNYNGLESWNDLQISYGNGIIVVSSVKDTSTKNLEKSILR